MAGIGRFQHTGAAPQTNLASSMMSTDTSFTAASGVGYPDGSVGDFVIAVDAGSASEEHILCSSRAGAVFTVAGGTGGRGYDNTVAAGHTAPTALIEHIVAATEIDDASRHINPTAGTPSDDHLNYPLLTGARAFTGGVTINTGGLTVSAGGVAITGASTFSSTVQATAHIATLTGTNGRYVGSTNGAPSSGTYLTGDFADDPTNAAFWICTAGGTSGSWIPSRWCFRAYRSTTWTFNPLSGSKVTFNAFDFGTTTAYSTSTGIFTAPFTGRYRVDSSVQWTPSAASGGNYNVLFYDGTLSTILYSGPPFYAPNSSGGGVQGGTILNLAANATLAVFIQGLPSTTLNGAYDGGIFPPKPTWLTVEYLGTTP